MAALSFRDPQLSYPEAAAGGLIVTGAGGWIGGRVVADALGRDLSVIALTRRPATFPAGVRPLIADFEDGAASLARSIEPMLTAATSWAVVHCAGVAHVRFEDEAERQRLRRGNVEAVDTLLAACARLGLRRFVHVSSIAVYDWRDVTGRAPKTESDAVGPTSVYGQTKLEGERLVQKSDLDWTIARLATVFGPGDQANFQRLARAIRCRRFLVPGQGDQRKSCIDVATAARALVTLAGGPRASRTTLNLALPESPSLLEISTQLARICHVPRPRHMPLPVLRAAAAAGGLAAWLGLPSPLTPNDLAKLCAWTWVDASRAATLIPELRDQSFVAAIAAAGSDYATA